jgi:hypothetical protein
MRCGVSARRLSVAECCYVNLVIKVVLGMGTGGRARGELNNRSISTLKIASVPLNLCNGVGAFLIYVDRSRPSRGCVEGEMRLQLHVQCTCSPGRHPCKKSPFQVTTKYYHSTSS